MPPVRHSLRDQLCDRNRRLDEAVRRRFGVSVTTFKALKAATQLLGVLGGIFAMHQGAQPLQTLLLMTVMVHGPEFLELWMTNGKDRP